VIWQRSGTGRGPVGMRARWKQVRRAGVVGLHPFTGAELGAVTLDAEAVPEAERGPFLQVVTPLTAGVPGAAAPGPVTPGPALPEWAVPPDDAAVAASAAAVTRLERLGFLRPGRPAAAARSAPAELAGWAPAPGGEPGGRQPVTLLGDLAIITRIRAQPVWVAEVTVSPTPARPGPPADRWPVLARMYAPYRPRVGLVEQSRGTEGKLPPYVLVRNDRAVPVLTGWCGADMDGRAGDGGSEAGPLIPMPTAEVSGAFAAVTQLRVAVARGPRVLLRTLLVATGQGRHWLLEGERWQRAVPVSADGLSGRVATLLRLPADG
jgi:hypothetical protein